MPIDTDQLKKQAALRAVDYVQPGMVVGLGTGSTALFAIQEIGARVAGGLKIFAIPTSNRSAAIARQLHIPLTTLQRHPRIDLTIDGADEIVLPSINAIKGLGGALLREKLVALASHTLILIVDQSKVVPILGHHTPIPVEVVPFGWRNTSAALTALGCSPTLRLVPQPSQSRIGVPPGPPESGRPLGHPNPKSKIQNPTRPYKTDSHNYLLDCKFPPVPEPDLPTLAHHIKAITGVVDHGLFLNLASRLIIARPTGTEIIDKPAP